jgi:hypothetical protein
MRGLHFDLTWGLADSCDFTSQIDIMSDSTYKRGKGYLAALLKGLSDCLPPGKAHLKGWCVCSDAYELFVRIQCLGLCGLLILVSKLACK